MSEERTYPREWFEVSRYSRAPTARTFIRETEKGLVWVHRGEERRTFKESSYSRWYPTEAEAVAAIAEHKARSDAADAEQRIRNAAPELLEACEAFVRKVDAGKARSTETYAQMKAAIARARGEN